MGPDHESRHHPDQASNSSLETGVKSFEILLLPQACRVNPVPIVLMRAKSLTMNNVVLAVIDL